MNETIRRTERTEAAVRAAIGTLAAYAPAPNRAPVIPAWVARANAGTLPAKVLR
jgi:hypothetical protein